MTVEGNSELFVAIFGADCGFYFGRSVPVLVDVYFPYCLFFSVTFFEMQLSLRFYVQEIEFSFPFFHFLPLSVHQCRHYVISQLDAHLRVISFGSRSLGGIYMILSFYVILILIIEV